MSEKFVASNGVELDENGCWVANTGPASSEWADHDARKEFYQHLRDAELGRWRWPESTSIVVYEDSPDVLRIFEEEGGTGWVYLWGVVNAGCPAPVSDAGEAYFAARPKPKPAWHDAKTGEVWVLTTGEEGEGHAWAVDPDFGTAGRFVYVGGLSNIPVDHPDISAGRRIWPEVVSDDS